MHDWSCHFLCFWVVGIEAVGFLIGTSEYNQFLVLADCNTLWIGYFHSLNNTYSLLFQVNDNWNVGYGDIRVFYSFRIKFIRVGISIELPIPIVVDSAKKVCILGRKLFHFGLVKSYAVVWINLGGFILYAHDTSMQLSKKPNEPMQLM